MHFLLISRANSRCILDLCMSHLTDPYEIQFYNGHETQGNEPYPVSLILLTFQNYVLLNNFEIAKQLSATKLG